MIIYFVGGGEPAYSKQLLSLNVKNRMWSYVYRTNDFNKSIFLWIKQNENVESKSEKYVQTTFAW